MSDNDTIPKKSTSQINKAVFFTSALLIFLLVAFAAVFPDVADKNFKLLQQQIFTNASWFYILAVALILLSVTFLGLSRYGDIKLGPDHAQPDFSYHSWFAMLFSAGDGDRPDVLWRCRTCNALSFASRWHSRKPLRQPRKQCV
ncbi:secondary glycine betaine transporter BetU [Klebsiella pneumoniae subsp. ozaenae]|uniref:Secondary glycine betaine transporter BetU n=1 Tax=Klebsiella pneumoniae subsp. ozaenae TaxID=574 RepID=A0A377YTL5_KLEPO|nr:secondary glycine betaine transporter BetU [Klebsiella pneumoniae subsp. ozaenae]